MDKPFKIIREGDKVYREYNGERTKIFDGDEYRQREEYSEDEVNRISTLMGEIHNNVRQLRRLGVDMCIVPTTRIK